MATNETRRRPRRSGGAGLSARQVQMRGHDRGGRHAADPADPVHRLPLSVRRPVLHAAEHLDRGAAGVDQHRARGRHDLRHPDRRHRPLGRLDPGGVGDGGGDLLADPGLGPARHPGRPDHRPVLRLPQRRPDRLRRPAAVHRHAGLADRGARHRPADGRRHHRVQPRPAVRLHRQCQPVRRARGSRSSP